MSMQFSPRLGWGLMVLLALVLQSGCKPIQPITPARTPVTATLPTDGADDSLHPQNSVTTTELYASPNGEWSATSILRIPRPGDEYYQRFVVENVDGSAQYTLLDGNAPFGFGYTVMEPKAWSEDNMRLYYGNVPNPDGCALFLNASDLYELDLTTGESREILPPNSAWTLAVSPDSKRVAYHVRNQNESALYVLDMTNGDSVTQDISPILGDDQLGEIVWSPESDAFAFVIAHHPCSGGWAASTSVYVVNVQDLKDIGITPHLQSDERLLMPAAWSVPNELELAGWDATTWSKGEAFVLDLTTNHVTPKPITPPDPSELTIRESPSPDGQWIATASIQYPQGEASYYQSLVVEHISGSPSYTLVEELFPFGMGYPIVGSLAWSPDGSRYYYGSFANGDGCGLFSGASDLFEFDTTTGQVSQILAPNTAWLISFAPDMQQIAYLTFNELVIQRLDNGSRVVYNIMNLLDDGQSQNPQLGEIVWSPTNRSFAFVIAHQPCSGKWAAATSIYIASGEAIVPLLVEDERLLIPIEWSSPQELRLATTDRSQQYILNLTDKSVTPAE